MVSSFRGTSRRSKHDQRTVQPPDAENRMSGGVEGLRGAIPAAPSDQVGEVRMAVFLKAKIRTLRIDSKWLRRNGLWEVYAIVG